MFQFIGCYASFAFFGSCQYVVSVYFIPSSGKYLHISSRQVFLSNSSGIYKIPF